MFRIALLTFVWYTPLGVVVASPFVAIANSTLNKTDLGAIGGHTGSVSYITTRLPFTLSWTNSTTTRSVSTLPSDRPTNASFFMPLNTSFRANSGMNPTTKTSIHAQSKIANLATTTTQTSDLNPFLSSLSITGPPGISPIPSITLSTTQPHSSIDRISSEIVGVLPILQSWVEDPSPPAATKAVDSLDVVVQDIRNLFRELKPDTGLQDCQNMIALSANPLQSLSDLIQDIFCTIIEVKDGIISENIDDTSSSVEDLQIDVESLARDRSPEQSSKELSRSSSLSMSSCSALSIARLCSVVCNMETGFSHASVPCSTTCLTTSSGCDAAETTTTTTRTSSAASGKCAANCGSCNLVIRPTPTNPCPTCATAVRGSPILPPMTRSTLPELPSRTKRQIKDPHKLLEHEPAKEIDKRTMIRPELYGSTASFIVNEVAYAAAMNQVVLHRHGQLGGETSAFVYAFDSEIVTAALYGLYGCTSVIVVSARGAWISHIWQDPTMEYTDDSAFDKYVLDPLRHGDGTPWLHTGIGNYTAPGLAFSGESAPQAFIITPQTGTTLMYPYRVGQIRDTVQDILPNHALAEIIPYTPVGPDPEFLYPQGKLLLQYDPFEMWIDDGQGCPFQAAGARLWWQDHPTPIYESLWPASDFQIVPDNGFAKRALDSSCLRSSNNLTASAPTTPPHFGSLTSLLSPESARATANIPPLHSTLSTSSISSPLRTSTVIFSAMTTLKSIITITSADVEAGPAGGCGLAGRTDCPLPTHTITSTIVRTSTNKATKLVTG